MSNHVLLLSAAELPSTIVDDWREAGRSLADFLDTAVTLWRLDGVPTLAPALAEALRTVPAARRETLAPRATLSRPATMGAAPFLFRPDGRPDWRAMWSSYCELALFGGPPHRGPEDALAAVTTAGTAPAGFDPIAEIRRGIWETTGLFAEPAAPGWLAVSCTSRKMAAWLCATIILENVDARAEEERLLVPGDPSFALHNQVKSVITVVAKTYHYWSAHVEGSAAED